MKILIKNKDINEALKKVSNLGFVPTMGSLHKGHEYLIKQSKKKCNQTLVSIFINPTQFNNKKDYLSYPKNLKKDLNTGIVMAISPRAENLYTKRGLSFC